MKRIAGYGALFNVETYAVGNFSEKIAKGAFQKSIKHDDVRCLFNHDQNLVLGRVKSKTLTLQEDDKGLRYKVEPPETQWAKDLLVSIKRGDVSQNSFGFEIVKETWERRSNGMNVRVLEEVKLFDVSPVTFPAYSETSLWLED